MDGGLNRRELTLKALAGLVGGALGWIPVEIVSHNHSLFEAPTLSNLVSNFIAMMILAGLVGGAIVASDAQTLEWTPAVRNKFLKGFFICLLLALPANYYANVAFAKILSWSGATTSAEIPLFLLIFARVVGWTLLG